MSELIVCLTNEVGIKHVTALIEKNEWEKVIVVTTEKLAMDVDFQTDVTMVLIDPISTTEKMVDDLVVKLKGNVTAFEVALNFFSGTGKEHMALFAALLKIGVGVRLVMHGPDGFKEL